MVDHIKQQLAAHGAKMPLTPPAPPREPRKAPQATPVPAALREGPTEAQIQKRKDAEQRRQEAALSKLNEAEAVHYQVGTGESTLGTVKVFHLTPGKQEELLEFLTLQLGARRC